MMKKWWHVSGVLFLMMLLMFTVSCEKKGTSGEPEGPGTNDSQVESVDMTFDRQVITSYLGKVDTVLVTAKALDVNQVGVSNVVMTVSLLENSPGAIIEIDSVTNSQGDFRAYYVLLLRTETPQTAKIRAEVSAAGQSVSDNIPISAKDIVVTLNASDRDVMVAYDDSASTELTVRVKDVNGLGVGGIPIKLVKLSGTSEASLGDVSQTGVDGAVRTGLLIDQLTGTEVIQIVASVDVPTFKAAPEKGFGVLKNRFGAMLKNNKDAQNSELDGAGGGNRFLASILADTISVTMRTYEGQIDSVYMRVNPRELILPEDSSGIANVYATAFNENGVGIKDLQLHFSVVDTASPPQPTGVISQATPTDSTGEARATLRTVYQYGTWLIRAAAGDETYEVSLKVRQAPGLGGTLAITATPPSIYADQGITNSTITATLKDNNQSAIVNDTVRFASIGGGSIEGFALTDDHGVATATFIDDGTVGTTQIVARYTKSNLILYETLDVIVLENRIIDEILLFTPGTVYQVSTTDSLEYRVNVRYETGETAVLNTPVTFETARLTSAYFDPDIANCDENGVAKTIFYQSTQAGIDSVWARAGEGQVGGEVHSLHIPITINPKSPARFQNLEARNLDGSEFKTNQRDPGIVTCVVVDTFFNPVNDGHTVNFTADKGTVTPSGRTSTDEIPPGSGNYQKGYVSVSYTPGTQAGQGRIWATSGPARDSVDVQIHSGRPQSILLQVNRQEITAQGTGGQETAQLTAGVTDPNGNPVENQTKVFFLMDQYPTGQGLANPTINLSDGTEPGNPYHKPFDSTQTNSGQAQVSINSGGATGLLRVRAWAFVDEEARGTPQADSVIAVFTGLAVVAGPPAFADVDVNEIGEDGGGAIWNLEVSARISDLRHNPVSDSIQVQFTLDPEIATIGDGFTGNEDVSGEITPGVANTILSYHSAVTNDSVTIEASVLTEGQGQNTITGTYPFFNLPIQEAAGVLYGDPTNWNYRNMGDGTWSMFNMSVFVYDGHDHCILDQLVRFLTDRGQYYRDNGRQTVWNEAITGPRNHPAGVDGDDCGWAQRFLFIHFDDAFPDPRILETTATANVEIIGYGDAAVEPVTLNLQH
ncbi:hypothetical protein ACFLQJ_02965 [Calditrichota bacterium]